MRPDWPHMAFPKNGRHTKGTVMAKRICMRIFTASDENSESERKRYPPKNKKNPQIVGLGPLMCSQIFWASQLNANQLNILVHLSLL